MEVVVWRGWYGGGGMEVVGWRGLGWVTVVVSGGVAVAAALTPSA
jgi:hypothetical protein